MAARFSRRAVVFVAVFMLSIAASCSVLWATATYGVGVSPDSVAYLSAAENLRSGRGYVDFSGNPISFFPPLYPALIAILSALLGTDVHEVARWVSALSLGAIVGLVGVAAWWLTSSVGLTLMSCVLAVTAKPLRTVSLMAWSEPLFIVLTMICLLSVARWLSCGADQGFRARCGWFCIAVAAGAMACLTRYAGVPLVLAGTGTLAWRLFRRYSPPVFALVFLVCALSPMLVWMARNRVVTGYASGPRYPSRVTVRENIRLTAYTIGTWYTPSPLEPGPKRTAVGIVLFTGAFAWLRSLRRRVSNLPATRWEKESSLLVVFWLYAILYVTYMVTTASLIAFDSLEHRLLSPVYPATLVLAAAAAQAFISVISPTRSVFVLGALFGVLARDGSQGMYFTLKDHRNVGSRYASQGAPVPGLRAAIEAERQGAEVALFSNGASRLWWTHRLAARIAPRHRLHDNAADVTTLAERYAEFGTEHRRGRRVLLVWYHPPGPQYVTVDDIRAEYGDVQPLWVNSRCTLYEVHRRDRLQ